MAIGETEEWALSFRSFRFGPLISVVWFRSFDFGPFLSVLFFRSFPFRPFVARTAFCCGGCFITAVYLGVLFWLFRAIYRVFSRN